MSIEDQIERERWDWTAALLREEADSLARVNLRAQLLPLRVRQEPTGRESEVEVFFWQGGEMANAAAWLIYLRGELSCETADWQEAVRRDIWQISRGSTPPPPRGTPRR